MTDLRSLAVSRERWTVVFACPTPHERREIDARRSNFAAEAAAVLALEIGSEHGTFVLDADGAVHHSSAACDPDGALAAIAALRIGTALLY
jgi:hypothetical protein